MIIGIGTDLVDINRIEKAMSKKFIARCFTQAEQDYAHSKKEGGTHIAAYARAFAAKEACAKALGCGIGSGAALSDIEILRDDKGKPSIKLHGAAAQTLQSLSQSSHTQSSHIHLSLSDEPPFAQAFVVIEVLCTYPPSLEGEREYFGNL